MILQYGYYKNKKTHFRNDMVNGIVTNYLITKALTQFEEYKVRFLTVVKDFLFINDELYKFI